MNNVGSPGALLSASNVQKTYYSGKQPLPVVRGVNLELFAGEFVTLIGASGAGKSTLLHLLGGMDAPDSGSVFIDGKDIARLPDSARARVRNTKIGFIFQFFHLLPEFTAIENVMLPALVHGTARATVYPRALELLRQVGLESRRDHKPSQLSGGEMQRVAFARALINDPGLVFADEPTGNLDERSSTAFIELMLHFNRERGKTFLIATHNLALAGLGTRRLEIRDGLLVF